MPVYSYIPYPRWMYHLTLPAVIVRNATEELALGPDWYPYPIGTGVPLMPIGYVDELGFIHVADVAPYRLTIEDLGGGSYRYRLLVLNGRPPAPSSIKLRSAYV